MWSTARATWTEVLVIIMLIVLIVPAFMGFGVIASKVLSQSQELQAGPVISLPMYNSYSSS